MIFAEVETMKISEALKNATAILQESGIEEARREANSLLAFAIQKDKTFLIAHDDYLLSEKERTFFKEVTTRRADREPFQYIIGKQEFFGLDFIVTPDVLIPRPETELIVENAIEILRDKENPAFCEVGVGSGCISVSILHEIKSAIAIGLDISEKALRIAGENAEKHEVTERLKLKTSDVFTALKDEMFELIVSNPPYIPSEDIFGLQPEVRDYEPLNALTDGENGLSIVKRIIVQTPDFLESGGVLLMEIGFDQSTEVESLFDAEIWHSVEFLYDLQEIPRTVKAVLR